MLYHSNGIGRSWKKFNRWHQNTKKSSQKEKQMHFPVKPYWKILGKIKEYQEGSQHTRLCYSEINRYIATISLFSKKCPSANKYFWANLRLTKLTSKTKLSAHVYILKYNSVNLKAEIQKYLSNVMRTSNPPNTCCAIWMLDDCQTSWSEFK